MLFSVTFWNSYYAIGHLAFGLEYPEEPDEDVEMPNNPEPQDTGADTHTSSSQDDDSGIQSEDDVNQTEATMPQKSREEEKETPPNAKKEL